MADHSHCPHCGGELPAPTVHIDNVVVTGKSGTPDEIAETLASKFGWEL